MRNSSSIEPPATQQSFAIEASIHEWGERIFALMDQAEPPSLFSKKGLYGSLMEWSMRDENFKTQLFRFVDVLPMLNSSAEISRHLREYLDNDQVKLSAPLRAALAATGLAGGLFGGGIKSQVTGMARMFMIGSEPKEIIGTLKKLHQDDIAFTVDILGEAVVSEAEADEYAKRYLDLMNLLAAETARWPEPCRSDLTPRGPVPRLNISIKISALCSQIHADEPDGAIEKLSARLRPILRRARELQAHVNFDMESYALKNLTLRLFKEIFSEAEFADGPERGLALQAYLRDCEIDLRDIVQFARAQKRRLTVRLVKGAYWDYETILAQQKGWPVPVFSEKSETDANFEKLSVYLLENDDAVTSAFATHNVRSIANVLAHAQRLGIDHRHFEFQMLYGMADAMKSALLQLDLRLREYTPTGELLPGMAYLVRRLLENTSNEGFLANKFARGASRDALLRNPRESVPEKPGVPRAPDDTAFRNEPPTEFTIDSNRAEIRAALQRVRANAGAKYPLVIKNKSVATKEWLPSPNPANQQEILGHVARATIADADAALASARQAQDRWAATDVAERCALLDRLTALLRREKASLTALEILEAGKSWIEADADVAEAIDFCHFYAAEMRVLGRPQRTQVVPGESNNQHWWPRGTGVVIAPWNFPLAILTGMTAAAVVAGNTVIMKPSEQTPVIAARLMELFIEAECPPGVVNYLPGVGSEIGAHLTAHPQIDFVAFTGSKKVGLQIWESAGRTLPGQVHLKKVICEMGGKNCLIVDSDADMDEAVTGVLHSAFGYNGQKCSALSRLVVLRENYDRFMERLIAGAASLSIGPAEEPGNILGPVIDRRAQQRILEMIEVGTKEATLVWQGKIPDAAEACYVPATIFAGVKPGARIFREEIFGPVLAVSQAKDFDEALALANDSDFALTGGCYSRSPLNIERVKKEFICGNLYINRPITGALVERQPFGGFKMSGGGTKAGGREYLQNFLVPRVITENCLRRGFAPTE